ncbi:MAG TPA: CDP-alcohol phosphatidyltransferase family protein [Thermoanaerobaculia bacterium]|nr:CDP-alcohol phosphatidyltransferase family protein [Thermoanaerobaculia bacterium]
MRKLPVGLVVLRGLLGPMILVACLQGWSSSWTIGMLAVAFVSDVLDGVVARRLEVATARLRLADSLTDTFFYLCVAIGCFLAYPEVWRRYKAGVLLIAVLEAGRWIFDLVKFGKVASYHMWSAKLWGITLFLGFGEVLARGAAGLLFAAAVGVGVVTEVEGLMASVLLPTWRHDVASVWHAWTLRRAGAAG